MTYRLILSWKQEAFDPRISNIYVSSRSFTLVTVKKEFVSLSHFIHLFFACSSIPVEGTATFKDVYFKLVLWIEKLFHLFLPCIGYNILQMAAFIRIPLHTTCWLYAFRNGPRSPPLQLHWNWWNDTISKSDPSSQSKETRKVLPEVSPCTLDTKTVLVDLFDVNILNYI